MGAENSVGREGIEPPQPKAADLQSAELTTLLNLPAMVRYIQFYRPERPRGRLTHDAECRLSRGLGVDNRLRAINENRTVPHLINFHL
jgi:hypothetical protein